MISPPNEWISFAWWFPFSWLKPIPSVVLLLNANQTNAKTDQPIDLWMIMMIIKFPLVWPYQNGMLRLTNLYYCPWSAYCYRCVTELATNHNNSHSCKPNLQIEWLFIKPITQLQLGLSNHDPRLPGDHFAIESAQHQQQHQQRRNHQYQCGRLDCHFQDNKTPTSRQD